MYFGPPVNLLLCIELSIVRYEGKFMASIATIAICRRVLSDVSHPAWHAFGTNFTSTCACCQEYCVGLINLGEVFFLRE